MFSFFSWVGQASCRLSNKTRDGEWQEASQMKIMDGIQLGFSVGTVGIACIFFKKEAAAQIYIFV